ncbi:cell wall protein DAN4-like, partial [Mizuhopecten yessoensis]
MSSRRNTNVSLPKGKKYHFNVIYNNAKSKLSTTPDTELSLKVTEYFIGQAKGWGYDHSYYVERDALPGQNIFTELFHVIDSSMYTIVILTHGFLSNCWAKYCQLSAFKSLLDSTGSDPISISRLIPVLVGVRDTELLQNLSLNRYVSFTITDWRTDKKEWDKVRQMMQDVTLIPGQVTHHPIQETGTPGTRITHIAQAEDTPSLSQFNRPPPETDGPRPSNASSAAARGSRTQREISQRQDGQRSGYINTQQVAVGGASTRVTPSTNSPQTGNSAGVTSSTSSPQTGNSAGVTASTSSPQTGNSARVTASTSSPQTGNSAGVTASTSSPQTGNSAGVTAASSSPQTGNASSKEPNQSQEQDLLRREIKSTTHVIQVQTEQNTTSYSSLPAQQFISSPPGPTITMPVGASAAVRENVGPQMKEEVTRLESQNLSNDMPSVGQSRSSKVIPPGDISGNLSQNPPGSPEETEQKQLANTVTTGADQSTRSTPFSDSGIGSTDTTPSPSLDPFSAMTYQFEETLSSPQEEISAVLQEKSHCGTTFSNQMSAPPNTQITKTDVSQDHTGTPTSLLPGHMSDSEARTSISSSRNEGMSETGNTTTSDRILDSIGSMQNQSDLDFDHGSLPSGGGPTAVLNAKSQRDPTSPKGDHSDQTSARGDNSDESARESLLEQAAEESVAMVSEHNIELLLSSSIHPIEDKDDFTSNRYEQLVSDKEETIPQKLSEFGKSEEVCRKSG